MGKSRAKQLLALCYAVALVAWLLRCFVGSGLMLYYRHSGRMPAVTLTLADFEMESLVACADEEDGWYVSSDADPHLLWRQQAYVETVQLHAQYGLPPGGVALYYLRPGQTEYRESQKVYARVTAAGEYSFDLGGRYVTELRIDPDSRGGVSILVQDVRINPPTPWFLRLVPSGGWCLLLLFAPALAAALCEVLLQIFPRKSNGR